MPYQKIDYPDFVDPAIRNFISGAIETKLAELHFLLTVENPNRVISENIHDNLQLSLLPLILIVYDGLPQILYAQKCRYDADRFKSFLLKNFPWDLDRPTLPREKVCEILWDLRNKHIHRFGLSSEYIMPDKISVMRLFTMSDEALTRFYSDQERPYSMPCVEKSESVSNHYIVSLEALYWGIRHCILNALSTREKAEQVHEWIKSHGWDRNYINSQRNKTPTTAIGVLLDP